MNFLSWKMDIITIHYLLQLGDVFPSQIRVFPCWTVISVRTAVWGWGGQYTHEGSGRQRAGCRLALDVGGGKVCPGSGLLLSALAGQHHAGQRELSPSSGARAGR